MIKLKLKKLLILKEIEEKFLVKWKMKKKNELNQYFEMVYQKE